MGFSLTEFFWPNIKTVIFCLLAFLFSAMLTWLTRIYALRKAILDIPNERSSHSIPTPRGGGIAIVITFILSIFVLYWFGTIETKLVLALVGGGIIVAALGYCDDVYTVRTIVRFLVQFIAALWAVYWLGNLSVLDMGAIKITVHWQTMLLTIIGIVWCINFYNFMDGIDGLAGGEAIFVCLAGGLALYWLGANSLALVMWLLLAAVAGFILWNWPPAKIFLGDVGSGFLGFLFATLALYSINKGFLSLSFWMILSAVFLLDATFTVVHRAYQGKRWYAAHREHAYQRLILAGKSHKQVTLGILLLNLFILMPLAYSIIHWPSQAVSFLTTIIIVFGLVWYQIKSRFPV